MKKNNNLKGIIEVDAYKLQSQIGFILFAVATAIIIGIFVVGNNALNKSLAIVDEVTASEVKDDIIKKQNKIIAEQQELKEFLLYQIEVMSDIVEQGRDSNIKSSKGLEACINILEN